MSSKPTYEQLEQKVKELEQEASKRKRAEKTLRAFERNYREIFNATNDAIIVHDMTTGKIVDVNNKLCELLGYSYQEVKKLSVQDLSYGKPPYTENEAKQWIKKAAEEGPQLFEWLARKSSGELIWLEVNLKRAVIGGRDSVLAVDRDITERKQWEAALLKSEKYYRSLVENQTDLVCRFIPDGTLVFVNDAFCHFFGKTRDELIGKKWYPLPFQDDVALIKEKMLTMSPSNKTVLIENRVFSGKGDIHWIQFINSGFFDHQGNLEEIQSVGRDITTRKRTEGRLYESEARLRTIFDASKAGIILVNPKGVITFANQGMADMFGCELQDLVGSIYPEHVHPDQKKIGDQRMRQLIAGEIDHVSLERHYIRSDGTDFWGFLSGRRHEDEHGNLISLVGIIADITELKQAEEALRQSEEIHRTVANSVWDSIAIVQDTKVMWANNVALEKIGYSENEFIGLDFQKIIHPDDIPGAIERHQDRISGKLVEDPTYLRIITKEGKILEAENRGAVITWKGKPASVQTLRDITEEKIKEKEKRKLEAQLQQVQKMESIGTLAGGIAHDFNNILSSIVGYTELTMDDLPDGSLSRRNLKEVFKAAMRAKDMVQQILAFSRKGDTKKKPIKVQAVIEEALKLLRTSIPTTIDIRPNIDPECGTVLADSTQIHQVVMNLATNAYQAMREKGGVLELALNEEKISSDDSSLDLEPGRYIKLTVSDTGHGMNSAVKEKIFDPYFTTRGPGEGTGMGLAVVHGIVKDHGGNINVHSKLDEGTTFFVHLPLIETRPIEPETCPAQTVPTGTERILLVDDEEPIAFMAQQILERLGYQVTARTSSVEALEAFRAKPDEFDLVVTDMTMPNLTGVELAPRLREVRPDIPIIICTGFSEMIDEDKAKGMGILGYAMKPIAKDEFARIVRKVLDEEKGL